MTFDAADLLGGGADVGSTIARIREAIHPSREVAGWATVELDRAEAAFGVTPGSASAAPLATRAVAPATRDVAEDARDELLGAVARVIRTPDGREIALLEPFTEGRLAAALARHGEGVVALYLIADPGASARVRATGIVLSSAGLGPFGTQRLVIGGPRWGPFIVLAALD